MGKSGPPFFYGQKWPTYGPSSLPQRYPEEGPETFEQQEWPETCKPAPTANSPGPKPALTSDLGAAVLFAPLGDVRANDATPILPTRYNL